MPSPLISFAQSTGAALLQNGRELMIAGAVFAGLAFIAVGREAIAKARNARGEVTTNLGLWVFDIIVMTPVFAISTAGMGALMQNAGLILAPPKFWAHAP